MVNISLVICTRNRANHLSETLRSLTKMQVGSNWELIIVNNGSTDNTAEILNKYQSEISHPFEIVNESTPGVGRARNAGWRIARGRFIAFIDDDCYPAQDYLPSMLKCFESEEIGFVGGRVLLHDPTDFPITIQTLERTVELFPGGFVPAGLIHGANFAFRRSALEQVCGFDERMGKGTPFACEDVEILPRILVKGYKGVYNPRPLIYHHHRRKTLVEASQLMKIYDYARGAYYAKCILSSNLRKVYVKNWCWTFSPNISSIRRLVRELIGAIHFISYVIFKG